MVRSVLTIGSELSDVARARDWISDLAEEAGLSPQDSYELQLVVSEACTNSITHAYRMEKGHVVQLSAEIDRARIRLVIRDFGRKLDLEEYREPDLEHRAEGGYGIYLLRRLMDEVHFDVSRGEGTELTLVKRRSGQERNYSP